MIQTAFATCLLTALVLAPLGTLAFVEKERDSVSYEWTFDAEVLESGSTEKQSTPRAQRESTFTFAPEQHGHGVILNEAADVFVVGNAIENEFQLPTEALSASAWVAIERPHRWGGVISCVQDDGDHERGFLLGYEGEYFSFALASTGADDGNGDLTYLRGKTPYVPGRWHHVVATYDGSNMRLYVDGKLDAESAEQSGPILHAPGSPLVIGSYRDSNEDFPLDGRLLSARLDDKAWSSKSIQVEFKKKAALTKLSPWTDMEFEFLVPPYLTWPTTTEMSVMFETTFPSTGSVRVRRDTDTEEAAVEFPLTDAKSLHECRLTSLDPDQKYFYQIIAEGSGGQHLESPLLSFRTAASPDKAFTFVVIGDTQTHGDVAKRVSDLAWMHRPNLVVHAGDLVDTGTNKRDWTDVFFPSMQPLIGRVPMMPVLGNHEQDAEHYYRYMSLPEPERWYSFRFGDAEFFMIDGNRSLADQSAQLSWLEKALSSSKAKWRFAVLHQPPYTSDSDDYGDTTKTSSLRGDPNVRNIVGLLERYGVDMCFSGHVHDYERTFPIRGEQVEAYEDGGAIYVTAAGGGGSLEDFDPTNTWFGHKKARYHHLVYVAIHGDNLEFQAIDEHGRLFDSMTLKKRGSSQRR